MAFGLRLVVCACVCVCCAPPQPTPWHFILLIYSRRLFVFGHYDAYSSNGRPSIVLYDNIAYVEEKSRYQNAPRRSDAHIKHRNGLKIEYGVVRMWWTNTYATVEASIHHIVCERVAEPEPHEMTHRRQTDGLERWREKMRLRLIIRNIRII